MKRFLSFLTIIFIAWLFAENARSDWWFNPQTGKLDYYQNVTGGLSGNDADTGVLWVNGSKTGVDVAHFSYHDGCDSLYLKAICDNDGANCKDVDTLMGTGVYDPTGVNGDAFDADNHSLNKIGSATYDTMQEGAQIWGSSGVIMGFDLTDNDTSQTYNIASGQGFIRSSNNHATPILSFDLAASNGRAISDGERLYISVKYNGGSPVFNDSTTRLANQHTIFEIGECVREGSDVHCFSNPDLIANTAQHGQERARHADGFKVAEGAVLSTSGLNVVVTAGEIYAKWNEFDTSAFDSSGTDTFVEYLRTSINDSSEQSFDVTNYDNAGVLTAMAVNRYGYHDVWLDMSADNANDTVALVYGTANATSVAACRVDAIGIETNNIPNRLKMSGVWIGRIIYQKSAASASEVQVLATTNISGTAASDHGNLAGLSDDDHTQYLQTDGTRDGTGDQTFGGTVTATQRVQTDNDTIILATSGNDSFNDINNGAEYVEDNDSTCPIRHVFNDSGDITTGWEMIYTRPYKDCKIILDSTNFAWEYSGGVTDTNDSLELDNDSKGSYYTRVTAPGRILITGKSDPSDNGTN